MTLPHDQPRVGESPHEAVTCGYCPRKIMWLPSYPDGEAKPFDAVPVARANDLLREGWLPAAYVLPDRTKPVVLLAPLNEHPPDRRRRAGHVMLPHTCPGQQTAQFWGAA